MHSWEKSELFEKQVNVRTNEKTSGVHTSSCKPTKVYDENESRKNDVHLCKMLLMEGRSL